MTPRVSRWLAFALTCCLALTTLPSAWAAERWVCPYDQSSNTGRFCPNCGTERPSQSISDCPVCHATLTSQANFCPSCGADLRSYTIAPAGEGDHSYTLSFATPAPTAAPTAIPTEKPTATSTPRPTATPPLSRPPHPRSSPQRSLRPSLPQPPRRRSSLPWTWIIPWGADR